MSKLFPTSMDDVDASPGSRVSILMRTKDRPVLLVRAFASVLNQTHQDWHLYLVNDGGRPGPVDEICAQYAGAFGDRLTTIHHETSKGMEAASNAALHASQGDFIAVHDDDDAWHPHFLARTVGFLNNASNANCAAVAARCQVVMERIQGDMVVEEARMEWGYWRELIDFGGMLHTNCIPPICLLIRRSVVDTIGEFNRHLPVLGDWDYNLRIMLAGDIGTINENLCYYHQRSYSAEANVYGNSVGKGQTKHDIYGVYYANSLIRPLLRDSPGHIGLMHILLKRMSQQQEEIRWLNQQLSDQLSSQLRQFEPTLHTINQMLRGPRWAWRKLYPFRRFIAKMRGRV
ncbi:MULTISPECIES: glycosyltransferase family 2 protein [unclassified Chelatococcus]|uniref:glycosyltransferase family 2 protein n=1 Tax=unclassified Chelatococcus TaxID=2638111 RepID=UPI001BD0A000|nr:MULTISPECIES: glycosyltransferase family 2 protein [unclassified Chelatococcus]MBS7695781.1 glycosyltransferase family 2 protein [Chelatococcus sp. YT9]MBX3555844.1 glycosyltransferase family 2 protein [Chelatococcus sp.]